ncbi:MAG: flagellar biosynthesis protein FlhA [Deltaproteobacteria bacterium HGW-Deltaproteobacteria-14]|jgi:flagellar biosynthesis protein FlhA|nr:MAG: flagellar biosynthesis protein FlhA [Deltaproteobacteria bacterium HGW-Deltaproteobacteria-14]
MSEMLMPGLMIGILGLMIVPLPTALLDFLLTLNITVSVVVLLTAIHVRRPLDFSVFPSLLLVTTLFRLGLNVSTTRLILLNGADRGADAAGHIVSTFGNFVVGGNYVVGIVVFLILTLINFIVITKGSGRIAEVSARFTLDALPGKQMSIDSDLASGLVTQDEARAKRAEVARETDFYGAMDGSSKFVRGDAIAGLIITGINILGGLFIGVAQNGMEFGDAAALYTVLTIGDGLVSQIPTLLISTAAGMVITRAAEESDLGGQVVKQTLANKSVLYAAAGILGVLVLVPGMPVLPFVLLGVGLLVTARRIKPQAETAVAGRPGAAAGAKRADAVKTEEDELAELISVNILQLEVGYGLIPVLNKAGEGTVVKRIAGLRKNLARELGIILPPVHVRDNPDLPPNEYRLLIHDVEAARGTAMPDRLLAMDPGDVRQKIQGIETIEAAFGLPALWIRSSQRTEAELAGYTVVEPETVIITHLSEIIHSNAAKLLGREELGQLLEIVAQRNPKVVEELIPNTIAHAEILSILRALLEEQVSIRDLRTILEALAEAARYGKALNFLVDQVRVRLGPAIVQRFTEGDGKLHAAIFDAATEDLLRGFVLRTEGDTALAPDLASAQALVGQLQSAFQRMQASGNPPVVLTPADLRWPLRRFVSRLIPQLAVMSQTELPTRVDVVAAATLSVAPRRPAGRIPVPPRPN